MKKNVDNKEKDRSFKGFYDNLLELANIFRNSESKKRTKIILDLLFLIVIVCVLKIPFIFIRDILGNIIDLIIDNNINIKIIWGLIVELLYVVVALSFFMKTLKKWISNLQN